MATIKNCALFFTTSPRTPEKMIPEIRLLHEQFEGWQWNCDTQRAFSAALAEADFFRGKGSSKYQDLSARDRINRAPKALGFVDLHPAIRLTDAGRELIYGKRPQEVFLRQLLKFQLPSPYHMEGERVAGCFCIRPYLEILRLIRTLGYLTFDEVKIFVVQMTDYHRFDEIVKMILRFRSDKADHPRDYKRFAQEEWMKAVQAIYREDILAGNTRTRQSKDRSLAYFLRTKSKNLHDYTDACFRYLRFSGLVSVAYKEHSLSIFEDRLDDVDFILERVRRDPVSSERYRESLFDARQPALYADQKENAAAAVLRISSYSMADLSERSVEDLKDLREQVVRKNQADALSEQVRKLKSYVLYSEVVDTYNSMIARELYDAPLMMEWNTWRAMTMLDGGTIQGNFVLDDLGYPLSTAPGNMPDIECDYGSFALTVEVTLRSGQRQFEAEGESVPRHLGQFKRRVGKETYCLFVAQRVNPSSLAHFYSLFRTNVSLYGGQAKIIPLDLSQFMLLIDHAYNYAQTPRLEHIKAFLEAVCTCADSALNELDWADKIDGCVRDWLT